jgi:hypothetical protein
MQHGIRKFLPEIDIVDWIWALLNTEILKKSVRVFNYSIE